MPSTRLFRANGTPVSRTALVGAIGTAITPPTRYRLNEDVFQELDYTPEARTAAETVSRKLVFRTGQEVTQAEVDALFTPATITGVTPASGGTAGGTALTITGTNFTPGSGITVGGAAATAVTFVDDRTMKCTSPAGTLGAKDVVVTTSYGATTAAGAFTYV